MSIILEVSNVTKIFGGLKALDRVSFSVNTGEIIGLIGPNGAGKSTLFNVISGVSSPTEGDILFKGRSLKGLQPHRITQMGIGRTFQKIRLFRSQTVLENVMVGRHCRTTTGLLGSYFFPKVRR